MNQQSLSSLIWSVADLLRGDYKQSEYGKVGIRSQLNLTKLLDLPNIPPELLKQGFRVRLSDAY